MKSIYKLWWTGAVLGLSTSLLGCHSYHSHIQPSNNRNTPKTQFNNQPNHKLNNDEWLLYSLNNKVINQSQLTLKLGKHDSAHGFAGCNRYTTQIKKFAHGEAKFTGVATTSMLCKDRAKNTIEYEFINALQTITHYQLNNNELVFTGTGNRLVFYRR